MRAWLLLLNAPYLPFGVSVCMGAVAAAARIDGLTLRLVPVDAAGAPASVEAVAAQGAREGAGVPARLGRTRLRRVLTTYGG